MTTSGSDSKTNDEEETTQSTQSAQSATVDASNHASNAAAYYQQYGYAYGYYPYNYGYAGYNTYDTNQSNNTAAYQQYYQQYQQQLQQQQQQQQQEQDQEQEQEEQQEEQEEIEINNNREKEEKTDNKRGDNEQEEDDEDSDLEHNVKDLKEWTHFEVAEWVKTVKNGRFSEYAQSFIDNEIDGKVLCDITPQQLQMGLYMKNMMKRLEFHDLIQTLKNNTNSTITTRIKPTITTITELERAPPIKKKKKRKKNKNKNKMNDDNDEYTDNSLNKHKYIGATASFLKLSAEITKENDKTSSQLLMEKMSNKRKLNEINDKRIENGIQHEIEWKYQENKQYDDIDINLNDSVLFKWEFTRNVWKFVNREAFKENNFNTFVAEELCGSNCNRFIWKPKKTGMHYFGCQVANCCKSGNMKIKINAHNQINHNMNDNINPNKKQRVE